MIDCKDLHMAITDLEIYHHLYLFLGRWHLIILGPADSSTILGAHVVCIWDRHDARNLRLFGYTLHTNHYICLNISTSYNYKTYHRRSQEIRVRQHEVDQRQLICCSSLRDIATPSFNGCFNCDLQVTRPERVFSGIIVYHLSVYVLGYPCLDQSMTPRLRFTSLLNRLVADTY